MDACLSCSFAFIVSTHQGCILPPSIVDFLKRMQSQPHLADVRFPCERREVAPPAPLPPIEARVEKKVTNLLCLAALANQRKLQKFVPIFVETAPISPPAYKVNRVFEIRKIQNQSIHQYFSIQSALRRSSPPPSYDSSFTFEKTTIEACSELPPRPRQTVRFAERA